MIDRLLHIAPSALLLCLQQLSAFCQSSGTNYRLTETMLDSAGSRKVTTIEYHDGLGRPVLTATDGVSTTGNYCYIMTEYDSLNRKHRDWMSAEGGPSPVFLTSDQFRQRSFSTHSDMYAYAETEYDAIGRPVAVSPGGSAWHNARKAAHVSYITNTASEVRRYSTTGIASAILTDGGYYPAGSLTGEERTDEDGHSLKVFKDLLGNTVLERRDGDNDTYFVYYNGLLRFVLMPGYQSEPDASQYYRYDYDTKGRCVKRFLPGCAYERYWYDRHGRVSFYQDGRLRSKSPSLYRFYLYDSLGRQVVQGVCTGGSKTEQASGQAAFSASLPGIGGSGYSTGEGHSLTDPQLETAAYYDSYSCLSSTAFVSKCQSLGITSGSGNVTGLTTAKAVTSTDGDLLLRVYHYDSKGQVTTAYETQPGGLCLETSTSYTFTGQPQAKTVELRGAGFSHSIQTHHFTYSTVSGLLLSESVIGRNVQGRTVSQYSYDGIGQVAEKRNDNGRYRTAYTYDTHGWLKSLSTTDHTDNSTVFSQSLFRAESGGARLYNGDIRSMTFSMKGLTGSRSYSYSYDGMDRLTQAYNMTIVGSQAQLRCETATYNANSAITSLTRTSPVNGGGTVNIDQLTYSYDGNRLKKVDDAYPLFYSGTLDFHNGASQPSEYAYDACGALTQDRNKGVAWVDYSNTGMPVRVQFHDGSVTEHVYTADGVKLKTVHRTAVQNHPTVDYGHTHTLHPDSTAYVDSTRYVGPYEIDRLWNAKYYFDDGYISLGNTGTSAYRYFLRDYQGNVRVVADTQGGILQRVNYYPYGTPWNDNAATAGYQTHKYGEKELDLMHGLNLYDFGAREYDPALGLFTSMDPLCEKYYHISPYAYCAGNPIKSIDPNGKSTWVIFQGNGLYKVVGGDINDNDKSIYVGYLNDQNVFVRQRSIGISSSTTSFYNSDDRNGKWQECIININDKSGDTFLSEIISNNPPLFDDYMLNARNGQPYDFKVTNGTGKVIEGINIYRGMPIGVTGEGQTIYTSARDIGNMAAGYIAAANGMSWKASRMAFDTYQGEIEGLSTRNAEYYGWKLGYNNTTNNNKLDNMLQSIGSMFEFMWNLIF